MKRTLAFVIAGITLVLGGGALHLRPTDVQAQTNTTFAIDADPTTGAVDATRAAVPLTNTISIDVVLTNTDLNAWGAYQVYVEYDDVLLDIAGFPTSWADAPVLNTTGGNLAVIDSGAFCTPTPNTSDTTGEDDAGTASLSMTCAQNDTLATTTYVGPLVQLVFLCEVDGDAALTLHGVADNFLIDEVFGTHNDGVTNAQIPCGTGGAPPTSTFTPTSTSTPSGPTNTPIPQATDAPDPTATKTPTQTRTPEPDTVQITPTPRAGTTGGGTAPGAPTQTGGPGGVISGPDTGTGPAGGGDSPLSMMLVAGGVLCLAVGFAPSARRAVRGVFRARGG